MLCQLSCVACEGKRDCPYGGTIIRLGKELGIQTPVCAILQQLIECVEGILIETKHAKH
nr:hypothetical protein [uncultured Treponema sp.]